MYLHNFLLITVISLFSFFVSAGDNEVPSDESTKTYRTKPFEFIFEGKTFRGLIDYPKKGSASSLIVLVPGHGKTYIASGMWNHKLRNELAGIGIATFAYDKAGCGNSDGTYDNNQTIENSSEELLAAITALKKQKIKGSEQVGLWGLSRAGWINPLVINKMTGIEFWISVSGPNHLENMSYLLKSNWKINGKSDTVVEQLHREWKQGFKIQYQGGSYDDYLAATPLLSQEKFIQKLRGGVYTKEKFLNFQKFLSANKPVIDEKTGLQLAFLDFEAALEKIKIPVLAFFGEQDSQVNWKETIQLYQNNIDDITVVTLPQCNHMLQKSQIGGFYESIELSRQIGHEPNCSGYYSSIISWLRLNGFGL